MTAKSYPRGHETIYNEDENKWEPEVPENAPCARCGKPPVSVLLEVPADLSHTGRPYTKACKIDACIAPIVKALNKAGIKTRACCCGHGRHEGNIVLEDGRTLIIKEKK